MSDLQAMKTLVAIRDNGSLTLAAKQMNEAKSTLSRRISVLEDSLEQRLTCQIGRRLSLTRAGNCYVEYAEKILELAERGAQEIKRINTDISGSLKVGLCTELSRGWSMNSLYNFNEFYPDIELEIKVSDCDGINNDPSIDLWITTCSKHFADGFKSKQLGILEQALYTSSNALNLTQFYPSTIENQSWISAPDTKTISLYDANNNEVHQLAPKKQIKINSIHMRADAIAQGYGLGMLPRWVAECKRFGFTKYHRIFPELQGETLPIWMHNSTERESLAVHTLQELTNPHEY